MFYLVRHGDTDYSEMDTKIYKGFGVNLSPLTEKGVQQIKESAKDPRLKNPDIILCSPYTRAMQTAAILSKALGADIAVETGLHEWVADKAYTYLDGELAGRYFDEFHANDGEYPDGVERPWEDSRTIRARVNAALEKYKHYDKVVVACHGTMIYAMTGRRRPENGEIVAYELQG